MRRILPLVIALATGLVALTIIGIYFYERPTVLRVSVQRGSDSQKLLSALNQEFIQSHADLRFRLVLTNDARAAAKSMTDGSVDLAVVRSDIAMPANAQTVLNSGASICGDRRAAGSKLCKCLRSERQTGGHRHHGCVRGSESDIAGHD